MGISYFTLNFASDRTGWQTEDIENPPEELVRSDFQHLLLSLEHILFRFDQEASLSEGGTGAIKVGAR